MAALSAPVSNAIAVPNNKCGAVCNENFCALLARSFVKESGFIGVGVSIVLNKAGALWSCVLTDHREVKALSHHQPRLLPAFLPICAIQIR